MAHINSLNSSVFSTLSYLELTAAENTMFNTTVDRARGATDATIAPALNTLFNRNDITLSGSIAAGTGANAFVITLGTATTAAVTIPAGTTISNMGGTAWSIRLENAVVQGSAGTTINIPTAAVGVTTGTPTGAFTPIVLQGEVSVPSIREFPSFGTPANIVNVPVYGQAQSQQVQGQSDAPSLEFTLNYVPTQHAAINELRLSGAVVLFRITLATAQDGLTRADDSNYEDFYFTGTIASLEITPALTDAMQANMALTIQSDFFGPYSQDMGTYGLPTA